MTSEYKGYYRAGAREQMLEIFKERLQSDPTYLNYILDSTERKAGDFKSYVAGGEWDWNAFIEKTLELVPWFYIPWYVMEFNILSDRVVGGLEPYRHTIENIVDFNTASMLLMFPDKEMEFQREQAAFYALVTEVKEGRDIDPRSYLERFGWMKTFILAPEEPLTEQELNKKIKTAIAERSDETYELQRKRRDGDRGTIVELESLIAGDKRLRRSIDDARHLGWLLTWSVETSMRAFAMGIPRYKEIADRIGLLYDDWVYLTTTEVEQSIAERKCVVSREEIDARKEAWIVSIHDGVLDIVSGSKAKENIEQLHMKETSNVQKDTQEVVGKQACAGKANGHVRICLTATDAEAVREGDILVCSMTTPDYVPAMKRAGAIVTDEGGLLCHAAIISRELGKPCVIATRIATTVFKTGDEVEVDADKGIVRKV
ncbi:hypothetical protein HY416_03800 [Candidatus Kaiserbacteria bacterium]|nr:hypothetical protein [Candidatus Kaiserbacteria bacterium]